MILLWEHLLSICAMVAAHTTVITVFPDRNKYGFRYFNVLLDQRDVASSSAKVTLKLTFGQNRRRLPWCFPSSQRWTRATLLVVFVVYVVYCPLLPDSPKARGGNTKQNYRRRPRAAPSKRKAGCASASCVSPESVCAHYLALGLMQIHFRVCHHHSCAEADIFLRLT